MGHHAMERSCPLRALIRQVFGCILTHTVRARLAPQDMNQAPRLGWGGGLGGGEESKNAS